jgi:two-component system chemotaxis response regulator CheY
MMMKNTDQHFLIVDDMAAMRRVVMGLLKDLEYVNMIDADDGSTGWKILEGGTVTVTFVITDWNMPVLDGIGLLKKIRATPKLAHLPVLMITAEAKKENVITAAEAGADGYIVKPFTAAVLDDKIRKILARRAQVAI